MPRLSITGARRSSAVLGAATLLILVLGACTSEEAGRADAGAGTAATGTGSATPDDTTESASPSDSQSGPAGGDEQTVASVTEEFYHALGAQDGARACTLMTQSMQTSITGGGSDCATAVRTRSDSIAADERDRLTRLVVDPSAVEVTGDSATVPASALTSPGATTTETGAVQLAREDGSWKVNGIG